jgi:hypothetical protein
MNNLTASDFITAEAAPGVKKHDVEAVNAKENREPLC